MLFLNQSLSEYRRRSHPAAEWKAQESLSETLRNLSEGRRMAAGAFTIVASAGVKMLEDELREARSDRRSSDAKERDTLIRYYEEKESSSVSKARLEDARDNSRLRSIMKTLGSLLIGAAITLYITPPCLTTPVAPASGFVTSNAIAEAFGLVGLILFLLSFRWSISKTSTPK